jgi:hypothetical protein
VVNGVFTALSMARIPCRALAIIRHPHGGQAGKIERVGFSATSGGLLLQMLHEDEQIRILEAMDKRIRAQYDKICHFS